MDEYDREMLKVFGTGVMCWFAFFVMLCVMGGIWLISLIASSFLWFAIAPSLNSRFGDIKWKRYLKTGQWWG